jgi:PAS domain-containing protein
VEYERLMERDGMVREYEYQVRARDGTVLWLSDSASAVRNENGELVRYEGTWFATRERSATSPTRSAPRMRSPKAAACCNR